MARFASAAALKDALNSLSPEDAWGDQASTSKMFDGGFRSLKHVANSSPERLLSYGIPPGQVDDLKHEARQAAPRGERIAATAVCSQSCWCLASISWSFFGMSAPPEKWQCYVLSLRLCCAVIHSALHFLNASSAYSGAANVPQSSPHFSSGLHNETLAHWLLNQNDTLQVRSPLW